MSPKASELHSSKWRGWGAEPRPGPGAAPLLGEGGGGSRGRNPPPPTTTKASIRAEICAASASSLSLIHLQVPSLPSVKPVWHLAAASSAVIRRTKDARHKRSYCKYDNSIRCCNQLCQGVTRARAHPHRNIWDLFFLGFVFVLVKRSETVLQFSLLRICSILRLILEEINCNFISSAVTRQCRKHRNVMNEPTGRFYFIFFMNLILFLCVKKPQNCDAIFWFARLAAPVKHSTDSFVSFPHQLWIKTEVRC